MNVKKRGRIVSWLLLLAMSVMLMACSQEDNEEVKPTDQPTGEAQASAAPEATPTSTVVTNPEITEDDLHKLSYDSLQEAYADYFMIGTIYTNDITRGADYELVTKNFNQLTPENILKPDATQPTEGNFTLNAAKLMMTYAETENMTVHGHVLAWHQQSGNWLGQTSDREVAINQLKNHINGVAGEFAGKIYSWDVVNEAIRDGAKLPADGDWTKCLRETQWTKSIGTDYIALAFQFAHEAAPDALLYYNDYNLDDPNKAEIVAAMVTDLRAQGVPVDGIGMQGHYNTNTYIGNVAGSLEMFSKIDGIRISFSELDLGVSGVTSGKLTEEQELQQAIAYAKLFLVFKDYADIIERVTFWGYKDNTSWRSESAPLLWDSMLQPKEAYYAVMNPEAYAKLEAAGETVETKQAKAVYGTPDVNGVVDDCWSAAPKYDIANALFAWQGATGTVQMMWDEQYLYVLFDVDDTVLNKNAENKYDQDSVEFFLDQNNCKKTYYDSGCGQYRCNYASEVSFGSVPNNDGFDAEAFYKKGGYIVEMRIPLLQGGEKGMVMGFDAQINDANAQGVRQSVMKFNATTDYAYNNPSMWAEVTLE